MVMMLAVLAGLLIVANGQKKVPLGLYFESCCPYCQEYIVNSFGPAWRTKGFSDIADVLLVPWGHETFNKSASTGQFSYECQHGPNECIGQRVEVCASMVTSPTEYVDFIVELETEMYRQKCQNSTACCDPTQMAEDIANRLDMDWQAIRECTRTPQLADQAEMMAYTLTMALDPALTGVPWITLQGNSSDSIQDECSADTLKCVCNVYDGTSEACSSLSEL